MPDMDAPVPESFVAHVIEEADNKIHDDEVARRFGFSGALVPGVELFARITTPLVRAWGTPWLHEGQVEVRFRRPVYDGEEVTVSVVDGRLTATGPDDVLRCEGSAARTATAPDLSGLVETSAAGQVDDPVVGAFGSVGEDCTVEHNEWYLHAVDEPLSLYREQAWAHPGLLLRAVNRVLMQNVALGPWIHTGSRCRFLGPAALPTRLTVHGRVTAVGPRKQHDEVRYDALVLADAAPVLHVQHTALYRLATTG
jgi:acyl dehydratase